ncbi:MAG: Hsp20/alpha crystallin family protein [Pseudomonadota bacterium]|nr:Hsp20/alpha crystallin family protein [Pseudomonadota bacterium]
MNKLVRSNERRGDPFGDFDDMFQGFWSPGRRITQNGGGSQTPVIDIHETETGYEVTAELPGVKKDDLSVSIKDGVLTINAETKYEHEEKKKGRLIRQERRYGKFVRSMQLGNDVDEGNIQADYKDGVLHLTLPKVEEKQPKQIDVNIA